MKLELGTQSKPIFNKILDKQMNIHLCPFFVDQNKC